ncbi:MAG: radical SAM protein [Candidatus Pacebacteria bacterium]|nr:radical SAM protein [Candidatus Paceibacterota bacterium]
MRKKKICLLSPPILLTNYYKNTQSGPTSMLWALFLATYLKEAFFGVVIEIIDGQLYDFRYIFKRLKKERFDVVGISPCFDNYEKALKIARLAKEYGAKVVLGGHYATPLRNEIIKNRGLKSDDYCVDAVIQYDGEKAFYEYVSERPLSQIKNLVYQDKTGQIEENQIEFLNLDKFSPINYGMNDFQKYFNLQLPNSKRTANIISHRGCFWREKTGGCIFCSIMDKKLRVISPEKTWQEINLLVKKYGVTRIFDGSDDFLHPKEWFKKFCDIAPLFKSRARLRINLRGEPFVLKNIPIFKKINVDEVILGMESLDKEILFKINKGINVGVSKKLPFALFKNNIIPRMNFIVGLPGENKENIRNMARYLKLFPKEVRSRSLFARFYPLPGSPAWGKLLDKEPKYKGEDLIDFKLARIDWIKHFCKIEFKDLEREFLNGCEVVYGRKSRG